MNSERVLFLASGIGLVLSVFGLSLPWGKEEWPPGIMGITGLGYLLGFELLLGTFALIGCAVTAIFQLIYVWRKKRFMLVPVLLGGLITMVCSLAWIVNPSAHALHWERTDGIALIRHLGDLPSFKVLYGGAYVSFFGAIITSTSAIANLFTSSRHTAYT